MTEKFPYLNKQARYVIYIGLAVWGFGGTAVFANAAIHSYAFAFLSMGIVGTVLFITEFLNLTKLNKIEEPKEKNND